MYKIDSKPWGEELWFAFEAGKYAGKIIKIKANHRFSLQYHKEKHETFYIQSGKARLTWGDSKENLVEEMLEPGDIRVIPPGKIHRLEAIEDLTFIEISTPQVHDVVRLEDDYGREDVES